jgi:hypothetical protein
MQGDLGQPRPELTRTGDEQAKAALLAQGSLEILRLAEYRGNAARHFHPDPSAVGPRVLGVIRAWLFNFGRNLRHVKVTEFMLSTSVDHCSGNG